jgi:hypothetical protein
MLMAVQEWKQKYTLSTKVCGHAKLVDSAISATPIADLHKIEHTAMQSP